MHRKIQIIVGVGVAFPVAMLAQAASVSPRSLPSGFGVGAWTTPAFPPVPQLAILEAVREAGTLPMATGGDLMGPITASFALGDLRTYDWQFGLRFSPNVAWYPADSVRAERIRRAAGWVERLQTLSAPGVIGRDLLAFAEVALDAGNDTLAEGLIERRLRAVAGTGAPTRVGERSRIYERAFALEAGTTLFSSHHRDRPEWLARRALIAARYADQLLALPLPSDTIKADSTGMLRLRSEGVLAVLTNAALVAASDTTAAATLRLRRAIDRTVVALGQLPPTEQLLYGVGALPVIELAEALLPRRGGRLIYDSLQAKITRVVLAAPATALPRDMSAGQREDLRQQLSNVMLGQFTVAGRIGRTAPPLTVHTWLNTPDTGWTAQPRDYPLRGAVRVLLFTDWSDDLLPSIQRLHEYFGRVAPGRVVFTVVTATRGYVGTQVTNVSEELRWFRNIYLSQRRLTFPIAVWAPTEVAAEFGARVIPSSVPAKVYGAEMVAPSRSVLIDSAGMIRGYPLFATQDDFINLTARIDMLLREERSNER